jgi:hypothetical protein
MAASSLRQEWRSQPDLLGTPGPSRSCDDLMIDLAYTNGIHLFRVILLRNWVMLAAEASRAVGNVLDRPGPGRVLLR